MKKTLYIKDAKGGLRMWSIEQMEDGLETIHGRVFGAKQKETEYIDFGLANRTKQEQIESKFNSKVKKRIEQGYSETEKEAMSKDGRGLNQLGLPRPMLAHKYDEKSSDLDISECYIQPKLDGHRCLVGYIDGKITAYSRNGKIIESIDHILEELAHFDTGPIVFDGELYVHGEKLQKISSLVRKKQDESIRLRYHIYDIANKDYPFSVRRKIAKGIFDSASLKYVSVLKAYVGDFDIKVLFDDAKSAGYEGLMIRHKDSMYEFGKRSKSLLKMKSFEDSEFVVGSISRSVDGMGILLCNSDSGLPFTVTAPGNFTEKIDVAQNPRNYIGKKVTIEYAGLTESGVPFHPVAKCWREND